MSGLGTAWRQVRIILEMIKVEHTLFALPFAFISLMLAARATGLPGGMPSLRAVGLVLAAMVGARSAAMAFNRIVDARFDAANPRTSGRALPAGLLTIGQVAVFTAAAAALLVWAAWMLNPLCFALSPVALGAVFAYSYTKRFTALSHVALGLAIGIAPVGAWLAVAGAFALTPMLLAACVTLWIGGFDIIYALQDVAFDRQAGLRSLPARIGPARALAWSRAMHAAALALLIAVGNVAGLGGAYYVGLAVVAALIAWEHSMVAPNDLRRVNTAFFTMNGWVSVSLLVFVVVDLALVRR